LDTSAARGFLIDEAGLKTRGHMNSDTEGIAAGRAGVAQSE
jgi:hypothetical protein